MKNVLKKITTILFLAFGIVACEVDRIPEDAIGDDTFWKTEADLKGAANYLYTYLPGFEDKGLGNGWMTLLSESWADDSYGRSSNPISDGSRLAPAVDETYNTPYFLIRACNKLLEQSKQLQGKISDKALKRYQGEAYFFRAFAYTSLVQYYGNVPLILKTLTENSEELYQGATDREIVIKQAYADLDTAIAALPKASNIASADYGRVSNTAALAFKARVALFEGTRAKYHNYGDPLRHLKIAKEASLKIIESGEHDLFPDFFGMFQYDGEGRQNKENILIKQYGVDRSNLVVNHSYFRAHIEQGNINPTKALVDAFLMIDGLPIGKSPLYRKPEVSTDIFVNRDKRLSATVFKQGDAYITTNPVFKIANPSFNSTGFAFRKFTNIDDWASQNSNMDLPIIRYAEVLLIHAEACYELDGAISDVVLDKTINKLRARAGIPALTNSFVQTNGLDLLNEIRRERRVELAQEGFRYWDLIRWKTAEVELPKEILGNYFFEKEFGKVNVTRTPDNYILVSEAKFRSFDPARDYLFPLPLNELALNKALEQNPKW